MIPLCAFNFFNFLLLVPETLYDRPDYVKGTTTTTNTANEVHGEKLSDEAVATGIEEVVLDDEQYTYWQSLKIGIYKGNVVSNFVRPWFTLRLPGLWVVMLQYGGLLGGAVTMGTFLPVFLASPPYLWGENVGLSSLAGVIGVIVGVFMTYFFADRMLTRLAKLESHGFTEPEARLPLVFPALFLSVTGLWMFGFCAEHPTLNAWVGVCVGLAMLSAAMVQIPSIGFNYVCPLLPAVLAVLTCLAQLIEAYAPASADCFVMTTMVRSIISFAWTYFVGDWVTSQGPAEPFKGSSAC